MKRILIMYISPHSGHHQAAQAVEEGIKRVHPGAEILNIDAFNYTNPILEKVVNRTYTGIIKRRPEVWEYLYDNPFIFRKVKKWRQLIHRFNSPKLRYLLDSFKPDAVICTQAFPCGMIADCKPRDVLLIGVLTDYMPHSYWLSEKVDFYVVSSEESKQRLKEEGIEEERIKILGIPVHPKFDDEVNRKRVFQELNLDPNLPNILIMGGGQGMGPIKTIIYLLAYLDLPYQILVVAGTNRSLLKWLKRREPRFNKIRALGYVDNVNELMDISSLIITKAGGITTGEALVKNLPMIIINPLPGQERKNTQFLVKQGVALEAKNSKQAAVLAKRLLSKPERLREIQREIEKIRRPRAAINIAKLICS